MEVPETLYARDGGSHIAYQTLGEGPPDIVPLSSWFSNVEADWDLPSLAAYLRRITSLGRLIHFELRTRRGSDINRILFGLKSGRIILLATSFVKKTQRTPVERIELAEKRLQEWEKRND